LQLTVDNGPLAGTRIPLERNRQVTIGSAPDADLHLRDSEVAPHHAVIKALKGDGFGIKALAPGMRINDEDVAAAPLQDGDRVQIGATTLRYSAAGSSGDTPIPGFRILGVLGKGGMGIVYRAEQESLKREVALKVLSQHLTKDPVFVAKFVAEARSAARLSHPNVVHVFDVDHSGDTYFYSMEVMHEGSLEDWLKQNGRMPVERALQVVADAASGLAYAESLGIVHRDIKPDNLMLDQHGTVKIADLGLALAEEDPEEKLTGTPHFMAPEQVLRKGVDHRTDLYALGCTFYRLITGKTPFRGGTVKDILRAHVKEAPEPPHKLEPGIPPEVSAIVLKLLAKEPGDRYQSANELLEVVHQMLAPPARRGLWIGLAAAAVAVAGGVLIWALTRPKPEATIVERYRDNPEAQRLALENERLLGESKRDQAEMALLRVRVKGLKGNELAAELEQVAQKHQGMPAAAEATQLAQATRAEVAAQQKALAEQQQKVDQAIAGLQRVVDEPLAQRDFKRALAALTAYGPTLPADVQAAEPVKAAVKQYQDRLGAAVASEVEALRKSVDEARQKGDPAALEAALVPLERALADDGPLPPKLVADRAEQLQWIVAQRAAANDLRRAQAELQWTEFTKAVRGDDGLVRRLQRLDFAGAGDSCSALAAQLGDQPAGQRAAQLALALKEAATFARTMQGMADKLQLPMPDGVPQSVARWQREIAEPAFVVLDHSRRPPKEVTVLQSSLSCEQWSALTAQVPAAQAAGADCFLALVAIGLHAQRAQGYLGAFDKSRDDAGTGSKGYTASADVFENLLRRLPDDGAAEWAAVLRSEVQAGRLMASGLRALSERRNLAAANHLERLLREHPHSLLVAALP
jgi:hypothetical protein